MTYIEYKSLLVKTLKTIFSDLVLANALVAGGESVRMLFGNGREMPDFVDLYVIEGSDPGLDIPARIRNLLYSQVKDEAFMSDGIVMMLASEDNKATLNLKLHNGGHKTERCIKNYLGITVCTE